MAVRNAMEDFHVAPHRLPPSRDQAARRGRGVRGEARHGRAAPAGTLMSAWRGAPTQGQREERNTEQIPVRDLDWP